MKVTLELPTDLVKRVKLRAVHDGSKLKDVVADLLAKGLTVSATSSMASNQHNRKSRSWLPVIKCKHAALPHQELSPERVAQILIEQEAEAFHGAGR